MLVITSSIFERKPSNVSATGPIYVSKKHLIVPGAYCPPTIPDV